METIYDLVLFDMDGTLLDSGDAHLRMFERFWPQCPENTGSYVFEKDSGPTIWDVLAPTGLPYEKMGKVYDELTDFYTQKCSDIVKTLRFIPEAGPAIARLRAAGVKTALITNSHWALAAEIVKDNAAEGWFDAVSGSTYEEQDKLERFETVMKKLGADRRRTLYVGDNESDGRTAHKADLDCCIVLSPISWAKSMDTLMREVRPTYVTYTLNSMDNIVL